MRKRKRRREGMTLVELIVSLALMSILMLMVLGVVVPAARTFARMQRVQFAQLILDNVEDEIRSQLLDAVGSVKIYDVNAGGIVAGIQGKDSGSVLEYVNTHSYVTLMSADGCKETVLVRSGQDTGTESAVAGRLLLRYYWQKQVSTEDKAYGYTYIDNKGRLVARAVQQVFTDKYYMGNYLKLHFSYPTGVTAGAEVNYIKIRAELYRDKDRTDLLAAEDFTAELRYEAKRIDDVTAWIE